METKQTSLTETLTEERVRRVGEKIAGLPTGDEFRQAVEDDLWREFTRMEEPPEESIEWGELPEESKSIFGYVDEEEETVPWWLESFRWVASSRGETIHNIKKNLSSLQNFDPTATVISKPLLADEGIVTVLKRFDEITDAIDENVGIETEADISLPSRIFEIADGRIRTTAGFKNWFKNLLELCPPYNKELTSLLMTNSNVRVDAVEELVPDELLETFENIGLINGNRIYQSDYHEPIAGGSSPHRSILKNVDGIFDLEFPNPEMELYRGWAENCSSEEVSEWVSMASRADILGKGNESTFGRVSFSTPLRLTLYSKNSSARIIYTTCGMNRSGKYPSGINNKKINEIMRSTGLLEE